MVFGRHTALVDIERELERGGRAARGVHDRRPLPAGSAARRRSGPPWATSRTSRSRWPGELTRPVPSAFATNYALTAGMRGRTRTGCRRSRTMARVMRRAADQRRDVPVTGSTADDLAVGRAEYDRPVTCRTERFRQPWRRADGEAHEGGQEDGKESRGWRWRAIGCGRIGTDWAMTPIGIHLSREPQAGRWRCAAVCTSMSSK